ncbi:MULTISPECIES: DUF3509 domain-containing protein [Pseudomonas]|uniref:DUF3509 domain-containing protein n=1 Tax=Pseudomonas aphyarum TaxID=2942629 RepID=A0ABT5PLZ1_9PSED|nr:DUF3509 domain-containing protein [Pseudomonas aphyarum]MDD0971401.1 DUF3509 domain-containing protein [Pseudomonas aphyarum]MDD1124902.1 DUF3509 domain-containing protein [Pseudomonas aphyarum]
MDNPFQIITDAFAPDYQINLSIQGLDGSIMLTLSNGGRIVAKRMISAEQRNDPKRLKRLVQSIQFGIAIEQGHSAMAILDAMTGSGIPRPTLRKNNQNRTVPGP